MEQWQYRFSKLTFGLWPNYIVFRWHKANKAVKVFFCVWQPKTFCWKQCPNENWLQFENTWIRTHTNFVICILVFSYACVMQTWKFSLLCCSFSLTSSLPLFCPLPPLSSPLSLSLCLSSTNRWTNNLNCSAHSP